ncbi:uncharacterized protein Z518_00520 [Rhinocladiella mackenziei CBS 650.93]|uniref:Rhinocladiella mackenziei CBS 650.93 unplaced genomic scaffold supercont1.1, whole genome shotgun sequence n=1 Tax=Rhinocladiella mackenziei CBS 650.93 TaxID=1442369 RepID=A0A0D2JJ54_9EURO|nr:uncharacterized protein Z518_00520 [Rhinocladiella mackenziei CBS 650.93]KIX09440.1 hypothetical protein Z518_00520 [Rhinocladiella mackenziei CBS 650.93]
MKSVTAVLFLGIAALLSVVTADLESAAALYPQCGLDCTMAGIAQSNCSATDQACICTNKQLAETVTACVASNCTIREQLTTQNVSLTACGAPIRDRSSLVSGFGVGGGAVALVVFVVRICAKFIVPAASIGYDDFNIAVAMVRSRKIMLISTPVANNGFGKDIWTIPFDSITLILKIYFIDEVLYITIISTTKLAILCFYLRVFPEKNFRRVAFCTMAMTVGYMIAFILVSVFQCRPVSLAWTHWDGEHEGVCNNVNAQGWAAAAINIALDLVILIMPLRLISKLNLHWKKKVQIMIMLSVGGFVTIVSILRLETLFHFATSPNVSWDGTAFGYWSCIEMDVGVICACMPALYSLFKYYFPQVFSGTVQSKSTGNGTSGGRSGARTPGIALERRKDGGEDFVRLVDLENVKDVRPGIAL